MFSYNGDNANSIDCYNKSLQTVPKFTLPFQNKLMNLNYMFDQFPDKMYITRQHILINKLFTKNNTPFIFDSHFDNKKNDNKKINVGIISGDLINLGKATPRATLPAAKILASNFNILFSCFATIAPAAIPPIVVSKLPATAPIELLRL
jgi:hypothetical protein